MTAIAFALTDLATGRRLGHGMICTEARYCTVEHPRVHRLDRRFVEAKDWLALERALSDTLQPGPIDADSVITAALLPPERRRSTVVQYLFSKPGLGGLSVATWLDAELRSISYMPSQRLGLE